MIISVANQKGGVGKTTTVLNIGAGLAKVGKKVLLIDADPQNHLSRWLDFTPDEKPTLSDMIYQNVSGVQINAVQDFIRTNKKLNVDYIPASPIMSGAVTILGLDGDSQNVLSRIFKQPYFSENYDYIIFDCQPSLDLLVSNSLKACDKLLIPVQADPLAYEGVSDMLLKLQQSKQTQAIQPYLLGMLLTMYQKNTQVSNAVKDAYITATEIWYSVLKLLPYRSEKSSVNNCLVTDEKSRIGQQYAYIVQEILRRCK
ncbi:MAG: ParA family protein [Acutalibacteraceae bacterium]